MTVPSGLLTRNPKEHAASLADERDLLRLVLDANPNLVSVKDPDGRFTLANNAVAELYSTTVGRLTGKSEADFNPRTDEVARAREAEREAIERGSETLSAAEAVTDPRTGVTRWFEVRRVPIAVPGAGIHVLVIASETTDRRAAEQAMRLREDHVRQSQKMEAVGQLAGGVAHDFNNLLTSILGYTALLIDGAKDQPELRADLEEIKKAGERAGKLTKQLLTFSKKQMLQPVVLNLNDVVSQLQRVLRRTLGDDVILETWLEPSLRHIKVDPQHMEQILTNLAGNARDAMPNGGVLTISTRNETMAVDPRNPAASRWPCVTLSVADTGSGIAPGMIDRVFEPFFTTKPPGTGTGLGLSMVYGVVTQSGGVITVESPANEGARFIVRFPAIDVPVDAVTPGAHTKKAHSGTETILLVEDEAGVRHLVQRVLSSRGYDVLEARDVAHAAAIATNHSGPIHLLLSDIVMPGLSGPDLAQRIIAQRPDVRVLYMSGFANRLSTHFGAVSSGISILHKPFTPEQLVRTVRDCLDVAVS